MYNSVPFDNDHFQKLTKQIDWRLQSEDKSDSFIITVHDIIKAVNRLKAEKTGGEVGLCADHLKIPSLFIK